MTRDELIAYLRNVARAELVDFLNDVGDELIEDGLISEEWGEEVLCDDRGKLLDEVFTDTLTLMKQNAAYELNCDVEDLEFYSWPDLLDEPATRLERLASEVTEANPDGHVFERLAALDIRLTNAARDLEVELMANSTNEPIEIMREAQRKLISLGVSCTLMFEDDYASLQVDVGVKNRSQESTESPWRD